MVAVNVPRILISGLHSGDARSLLGVGLALALKRRKLHVACAVRGVQSAQATYYRRITQRLARTIDEQLMHQNQVLDTVASLSIGADIILIEGNGGIFDKGERAATGSSDSDLASLIRAPVVLVMNAGRTGETLGAIAKGVASSTTGYSIEGVVVSNYEEGGGRDTSLYDESMRMFDAPPFLGSLHKITRLAESAEYLSRSGVWAHGLARDFLSALEQTVEEQIQVDRLLATARSAPPLRLEGVELPSAGRRCKVGVADDPCFQPVFQDNLDIMRRAGAELASFSPLADGSIPKGIHALYFGSAFLQEYGAHVSANSVMRRSILEFYNAGGTIYSEGTGTAYLCEKFLYDESPVDGVGIVPGTASPRPAPTDPYVDLVLVQDSILGPPGALIRGVRESGWGLDSGRTILHLARTQSRENHSPDEGLSPGAQVFATFCNLHWGSNPSIAQHFVSAAVTR